MRQSTKNVSPMSNEGRNAYVIGHLTDALMKLLRDKPLEAISISELCELAGIGRASFYRNFKCKEDILRTCIRQLFSQWFNTYIAMEHPPLSTLIQLLFSHFEKHMDFYRLLYERKQLDLLKDIFIELLGPAPELPKAEAYAKAFVAYALYGWVEVWFLRGMKESAEEMQELFQSQEL